MECAVKNCSIVKTETEFVGFSRKRKNEWSKLCGYQEGEPINYKKICKGHFDEKDFLDRSGSNRPGRLELKESKCFFNLR